MKDHQTVISLDLATLENIVKKAKLKKETSPSEFTGIVSLRLVGPSAGLQGEEDYVVGTLERKGFGVKPEFLVTNAPD